MASALFDVNADGSDQGYQAVNSEVLTLRLRQQPPLGVNTVQYQVFNPAGFDATLGIAANPPRASKGAPTLTLVGASSGQAVSPATVDGTVAVTLPATGSHSWIVRCVVNGGTRTLANGTQVTDPSLINERGIYIRTAIGARKVVCTELRQFENDGWAGAIADLPDLVIPDHAMVLVKLPSLAAAPSVLGGTVNGNVTEMPAAALAAVLRGGGMTVSGNTLEPRPRPRRLSIVDSFTFGTLVSGGIGDNGWTLLGVGTPTVTRSTGNLGNSVRLNLVTSAVINDLAVLCAGEIASRGVISGSDTRIMQIVINMVVTGRRVFFGLSADFTIAPASAVSCVGFLFDTDVSPNWQIIARTGSVGTPVITAAVVPSTTAELLSIHQSPAGTFKFYVGPTLVGTIASGLPTGDTMNFGVSVRTLASSAATVRMGRIIFDSMTLTGTVASDTFLEA